MTTVRRACRRRSTRESACSRPKELALILLPLITRHLIAPAWAAWERSPYLRHYRRLLRTQFDPPEVDPPAAVGEDRGRSWITPIGQPASIGSGCRRPGWSRGRIRSFDDFVRDSAVDQGRPPWPPGRSCSRTVPRTLGCTTREPPARPASRLKWWSMRRPSSSSGPVRSARTSGRAGGWASAVAVLWGAEEDDRRGWRAWLRNTLLERITLPRHAARSTRRAWHDFSRSLRRKPPALLFGHAHSLYLFAQYVREPRPTGVSGRAASSRRRWCCTTGNAARSKRCSSAR